MSLVKDQLANSPIERWVKQVELDSEESSGEKLYNLKELYELVDRIQLAKRSRPSYRWRTNNQEKWLRIWFKESNITIQIDLHFSDGNYQMNMSEIDLEQCTTATNFLEYLYHTALHKQWACPEMLWAIMEVAEEASKKRFGKNLSRAFLDNKEVNWTNPNL
ncbi:MAG: hypothetical protein QNJ36_16095 [Calothrix sp. MO_167.B42]|nr:hypothetical protein [Calothrix sp. MO_167.B42]